MTIRQDSTADLARRLRLQALRMVHRARSSHIGGCLSVAELLAGVCRAMRVDPERPDWSGRDRFIMSKGHSAAIVYAALAETGFIPESLLESYCEDGSILTGHVSHHVPGVDFSTGSLGHGLSVACGMAMAGRMAPEPFRAYVILSDGEMDEGSVWEPILLAPHIGLDNLVALVDYNKIQSFGTVEEVLDLSPLADKWRAFGWGVREIDGHDPEAVDQALAGAPFTPGKPSVVIAHTVKGKGVPFMENDLLWHYRPPSDEQLEEAIAAVERAGGGE